MSPEQKKQGKTEETSDFFPRKSSLFCQSWMLGENFGCFIL